MSESRLSPKVRDEASLDAVRRRIDAIDQEIQRLLEARAEAALEVAEIKLAAAGDGEVDFYRPEREAQILRRVAERNRGPLSDENVRQVFREIISGSLALEQPLSVAYLGPEGTFTHAATLRHFGHAVRAQPESGIAEIFRAVESGRTRFGVVPVENSTEGAVAHTLDLLLSTPLSVCGEVNLGVRHCLMGRGDALEGVTEVHAHPQALAQCRAWLDTHLPGAQRVPATSNAAAAERVAQDAEPGRSAIAAREAAARYGLTVLRDAIEDEKSNTTRFLVLGDAKVPPSGDDVTSLVVSAAHRPGGLREMLLPFESANVSLHRIESRPARSGLWKYVFFIDVSGHRDDENLAPVLARLSESVPFLKVLGSYPAAL